MQAIITSRYGTIDVLEHREIAQPRVGEREVLVRVRAAGLHVGDLFGVKGAPLPVRFMMGLTRPRYGVPGLDLAGEVETIGPRVTGLRVGDRVFGTGTGTAAEYARAAEHHLVPMPTRLSFTEAAALPTSGLAALHGLRDAGRLEAGQHVLINGAAGGVGSFAVQIAKAMGAEVTGVASSPNVDFVRSLGADHVIDYTHEDFTTGGPRYDLILDNVENHPVASLRRALKPRGTLVLNSGTGASGLAMFVRLVRPLVLSPFVSHGLRRYLSNPNREDLLRLRDLVERGQVKPMVERTFALADTVEALRHIETGRSRGKVVVTVA